jgi:hypothetical protein
MLRCRWIGTLFVGFIALSVAILAALLVPGQAEAQEQATPETTTKVVEPGDSLWTIAQARLSPDYAPQLVAEEVGRIYELNRDQIGDNPNLIFPDQQFFLTSAAANGDGRAAVVPEEEVVSEAGVYEGTVSQDVVPAQQRADQTDQQAQSTPAESVTAESVTAESVTAESAPSESIPAESTPATTAGSIAGSLLDAYNNLKVERRLLGVGILALTLIVALLMAWRLPMKRNVGEPQAWGIPQQQQQQQQQQYDENYAPAEAPLEAPPKVAEGPECEPGSSASGSASGPPPQEATREPTVSSDTGSSSLTARGAEEDVVAEGSAVATSNPGRERLRRVHSLRRISRRRSQSRT